MKIHQLHKILPKLDPIKRVKFHNHNLLNAGSLAINAIVEHRNVYIFYYIAHPKILLDSLTEDQKLVWYNPNCCSEERVRKYFPYYNDIAND